MGLIVWYDGINLNLAWKESVIHLKRGDLDVVIPTTWESLRINDNGRAIDNQLSGFYLAGLGRAVLVALPQGSRIGFIYDGSEIRRILQKIPDLEKVLSHK